MFFISEGPSSSRRSATTVELGPGEFFGELALMTTDATRTARVRAKTLLRCLALDRDGFRELVSAHPEIAAPSLLEGGARTAWPRTPAPDG